MNNANTTLLAAQFASEMGYTPQIVESDGELAYFSAPDGKTRKYWARVTSRGIKKNSIRIN